MNNEMDPDKKKILDRVFRVLRKRGLQARQNFWCCASCALSALDRHHRGSMGFVFYHKQDHEHMKKRGLLYLRFGSFKDEPGREKTRLVGQEVCIALREEGLSYEWDGSPDQTIRVNLGA